MAVDTAAAEMSQGMKTLHMLLQRLDTARERLQEGPRRIAVAERQLARTEAQVEEQQQKLKELKKRSDAVNLNLKAKESDILKLEGQLNTATSNEVYSSIKSQIVTVVKARGEMEEEGLLALEAIDEAEQLLQEQRKQIQQRSAELQTARDKHTQETPLLEAEIAEVEQQVLAATVVVPAAEHPTLMRLRTAHGAGALATVEEDFCTACDTRVIAQDMVRMRTAKFVQCRDCGRILYVDSAAGSES